MEKKILNKSRACAPLLLAALLAIGNIALGNDRVTVPVPDKLDINNGRFENLKHESSGAGVYNEGTVNIKNTTFKSNSIEPPFSSEPTEIDPYSYTVEGAAAVNHGEMNIENSVFENNTVSALYRYIFKLPEPQEEGNQQTAYTMSLGYGCAIDFYGSNFFNSKLNIQNSTFESNKSGQQGGALNLSFEKFDDDMTIPAVEISNSEFKNNFATQQGGAISTEKDTILALSDSTFDSNKAYTEYKNEENNGDNLSGYGEITSQVETGAKGDGGAIYNENIANINNSTFSNNTAAQKGGAIYNKGTLSVSGSSKFSNNTVKSEYDLKVKHDFTDKTSYVYKTDGMGGAIHNEGITIIDNAQFSNNTAGLAGGAIANGVDNNITDYTDTYSLDIKNSTFENNSTAVTKWVSHVLTMGGVAEESNQESIEIKPNAIEIHNEGIQGNGGAIFNGYNSVTNITDSSFIGNMAYSGGAIYNFNADVNIKDTSFIGNKAEFGGAIASDNYALDIDKTPTINITAENKNVEFKDNTANQGGTNSQHQRKKVYGWVVLYLWGMTRIIEL